MRNHQNPSENLAHNRTEISELHTPVLAPGVNALLRDREHIQVGLHPSNALIIPLALAQPLLNCMDGTHSVTEINKLLEVEGFTSHDVQSTVRLLADRNLIIDSRSSSRQHPITQQVIHIHGGGRLGTTLAVLLAQNPVVDVRVIDRTPVTLTDMIPWGASRIDIGLPRQTVADLLVERVQRGTVARHQRLSSAKQPDLIILAPDPVADWPWLDPMSTNVLIANDQPHMAITYCSSTVHISHVITPGVTACLSCMHHTLTDQDPAWPALTNQLFGRTTPDDAALELITFAAVIAAQKLSSKIVGDVNDACDLFTQLTWPDLARSDHKPNRHPACGCAWDDDVLKVVL